MSAVEQFPQSTIFNVLRTSTTNLGFYTVAETTDLSFVNFRVFNKKTGAYTYTLKLEVAASIGGTTLASSEVATFSDTVTGQTTSDFLADVSLEFTAPYTLTAGIAYLFRLVTTGYTFSSGTSELCVWCDWLEPVGSSNTAGARLAIGGYR